MARHLIRHATLHVVRHVARRAAVASALLAVQMAWAAPAQAGELVGRVVDAVDAKVFANAVVTARAAAPATPAVPAAPADARTDAQGFFRLAGLPAGAYLLDVSLSDGRSFLARQVMLPGRALQYRELDYSRAVPPDDDDDY